MSLKVFTKLDVFPYRKKNVVARGISWDAKT
jgi:hypothetical protein